MVIIQCGYHPVWSSSSVVLIQCGHHPVWSSSSVVIIQCGHHPVWSSSSVVIIQCGHHLVWSSSSVVIIQCGHHPVWSSSSVVIIQCGHHPVWSSFSVVIILFGCHPVWSSSSVVIIPSLPFPSCMLTPTFPMVKQYDFLCHCMYQLKVRLHLSMRLSIHPSIRPSIHPSVSIRPIRPSTNHFHLFQLHHRHFLSYRNSSPLSLSLALHRFIKLYLFTLRGWAYSKITLLLTMYAIILALCFGRMI